MHREGTRQVKHTCNECRARKVRCDGQRTGCANCQRLGFACSFQKDDEQHDSSLPLQRPRRCRVRQACTACHELKIRCSGSMPKCHRCNEKSIACVYSNSSSRRRHLPTNGARSETRQHTISTTQSENRSHSRLPSIGENTAPPIPPIDNGESHDLLTPGRIKKALQSFFDSVYPLPTFSFLHKASLLRWNQTGQADHCLLLSLIAITSRLPGRDPAEVTLGVRCSAVAQSMILKDQGRPNVIKAQSLLLIIRYHMWSGNTTEALILMATLARFAFALRLNYENPRLCSLAQESRRRLIWAVYVLDTFLAGGLPEFTLCSSNVLHLSLPNKETAFELDTSYANFPLHGSDDSPQSEEMGLLAYYIRIIYLRDSVLRRTKEFASSTQQAGAIISITNELKLQLDHFALTLPGSVTFSEKNLQLRGYSEWLPRFILMHLWFQQCYCDLYRCFFNNLRESYRQELLYQLDFEFVLDCQVKCLQHARQIATICSLFRGLGSDDTVLDVETAECVYQAGRILLHGSQITMEGNETFESSTVGLVNECILFIEHLALMFPTAAPIAKDLSETMHRSRSISVISNDDLAIPGTRSTARGHESVGGRQIISKHSSLNRSHLNDEAVSEDMPFVESRRGEHHDSLSVAEGGSFVSTEMPASERIPEPVPISIPSFGFMPRFNLSQGIPDPRGEDLWNQTSAFEGAWDVAFSHPMNDQQDMWPSLSFFPNNADLDRSGG